MKLWSNYLQHRGNQKISLYKASLQSIQKCAKMTVSQTFWLSHHQFLHFHTSIFDTKKFIWQNLPCQEKRRRCDSSQSHHPLGAIPSFFSCNQFRETTVSSSGEFWPALTSWSHFLWLSRKQKVQDPGSNKGNGCLKQVWRKVPTLDHPREETKQK